MDLGSNAIVKFTALSPPKGDWVATVEGHAYEGVYTYSEKNYADFCTHFSWGLIWFNQAIWSGRHFISWKAARPKAWEN